MTIQKLITEGTALESTFGRSYLIGTQRHITINNDGYEKPKRLVLKPGAKFVYMRQYLGQDMKVYATIYYKRVMEECTVSITASYGSYANIPAAGEGYIHFESFSKLVIAQLQTQLNNDEDLYKKKTVTLKIKSIRDKWFERTLRALNLVTTSSYNPQPLPPTMLRNIIYWNNEKNKVSGIRLTSIVIQTPGNKKLKSNGKKAFMDKLLYIDKTKIN